MTALALAHQPVSMDDWQIMREQAAMLVKTGFLPKAIDTPEKAVAIMLKGRELQVPPMHALSQIAVIQGKPTASAELMLALIYRDHGDNAIRIVKTDNTICTVAYQRRAWPEAQTFSFTLEDAKQANLLGKEMWKAYPQAMLRARCISAVGRMAFADSIGGMYTPEEMGAVVDEDGQVIERHGAMVHALTGEIVEPTPIRPQLAAAPAPDLAKLRESYARGVAKAADLGLAAPALADEADEMTIRRMAADIQMAIKVAHSTGYPAAYGAALGRGEWPAEDLRQDITAPSFMADPAGHLRETMAAWSPDSAF